MDAVYSKRIFDLNWPFFAEAERISPINRSDNWKDPYMIGDRRLRACSQWFEKDREAFSRYHTIQRHREIVGTPESLSITGSTHRCERRPAENIRYKSYRRRKRTKIYWFASFLSNLGSGVLWSKTIGRTTKSYFGGKCAYCGEAKELHMDHGIPINKTCLGEHTYSAI